MREQENSLFERWRNDLPEIQRGRLVRDGVVDEESYNQSTPKILLLLKEVNDPDGGGWCLREFLGEGGRSETWKPVTRWVRAIRNLQAEIPWDELEDISDDQRREELRSIAAMNLKKIPGGHTTKVGPWWEVVRRDQEYIRQQFAIYDADLVICCGKDVAEAFDEFIKADNAPKWQRTSRGIQYLEYKNGKFIIKYSHPQARVASNLIHYALVDTVREIFRTALGTDHGFSPSGNNLLHSNSRI